MRDASVGFFYAGIRPMNGRAGRSGSGSSRGGGDDGRTRVIAGSTGSPRLTGRWRHVPGIPRDGESGLHPRAGFQPPFRALSSRFGISGRPGTRSPSRTGPVARILTLPAGAMRPSVRPRPRTRRGLRAPGGGPWPSHGAGTARALGRRRRAARARPARPADVAWVESARRAALPRRRWIARGGDGPRLGTRARGMAPTPGRLRSLATHE